MINTVTSQ